MLNFYTSRLDKGMQVTIHSHLKKENFCVTDAFLLSVTLKSVPRKGIVLIPLLNNFAKPKLCLWFAVHDKQVVTVKYSTPNKALANKVE